VAFSWDDCGVNLAEAEILNASGVSLTIGPNSLVLLPPGAEPESLFGSYSCAGTTHVTGTPLVVPQGASYQLTGRILDLVECSGELSGDHGSLDLLGGLRLLGGTIRLGDGTLVANGGAYGMEGGYLYGETMVVGRDGEGVFTHTAGTNSLKYVTLGETARSSGTYRLLGGGHMRIRHL